MSEQATLRRDPTPDEQADIVGRYRRGQTLEFIRLATDFGRPAIKRVLAGAGVKLRRRGSGSSNWGYTGSA